jgi:protein TonB
VPAPRLEPPRADMAYLNNPPPAYPAVSKRAGEQGRVMLRVRVDASGVVEAVELQATSGFPRLDEAALAAVRRWRFVPAKLGERAVAGWAVVPISFSLRG